jgi:hypothetical protein
VLETQDNSRNLGTGGNVAHVVRSPATSGVEHGYGDPAPEGDRFYDGVELLNLRFHHILKKIRIVVRNLWGFLNMFLEIWKF